MKHFRQDYQDRIVDKAGLIPDAEPVFLIRGQDKAAPVAVRAWAINNQGLGGNVAMSDHARKIADEMEAYQAKEGSKLADLPAPGTPPTGSDPGATASPEV